MERGAHSAWVQRRGAGLRAPQCAVHAPHGCHATHAPQAHKRAHTLRCRWCASADPQPPSGSNACCVRLQQKECGARVMRITRGEWRHSNGLATALHALSRPRAPHLSPNSTTCGRVRQKGLVLTAAAAMLLRRRRARCPVRAGALVRAWPACGCSCGTHARLAASSSAQVVAATALGSSATPDGETAAGVAGACRSGCLWGPQITDHECTACHTTIREFSP